MFDSNNLFFYYYKEEELKDEIAKMSINDTETENKNLKDVVESEKMKNKDAEVDLFSQMSTAPNSPATQLQHLNEVGEDQELSKDKIGS